MLAAVFRQHEEIAVDRSIKPRTGVGRFGGSENSRTTPRPMVRSSDGIAVEDSTVFKKRKKAPRPTNNKASGRRSTFLAILSQHS